MDIASFLRNAGLEKYTSSFVREDFDDVSLLKDLSEAEIKELADSVGMGKGAELKLRRALSSSSSFTRNVSMVTGKRKIQLRNGSQGGHKQARNAGGVNSFIRNYNNSGFQVSQGRQVFVSNIGWDSRWKDLKELLSVFGDIVRCTLERKEDGLSKGSALVLFKNAESAKKCVNGIKGMELDGRPLYAHLDKFEGRPRKGNEKRVFVGNLPFFVNWGTLKSVCLRYGQCHADLATDDQGRSKGYGVVEFKSQNAATSCVRALNGQIFLGRRIIVKFDNLPQYIGKVGNRKKKEVPSKDVLDKEMEAYSAEVAQ